VHDDTSIPGQFFIYPRFSSLDFELVWLLIRGYINQLCGETPTDLRVGIPMPTTNLAGLPVTLTDTRRKAAVNFPFQSGKDPRELEDWLEAQLHRFLLLGITDDSYDSVIWVTSQFFGHLNGWWLKWRRQLSQLRLTYLSRSCGRQLFSPTSKMMRLTLCLTLRKAT
jgi:hypothetical protein